MTEGSGKQKQFQTVSTANLSALTQGNIELSKIAEELGRSTSTLHKWLNEGQMPKDASLACEALRYRFGGDRHEFLLLRGNAAKIGELKPVLDAFGFEYKEMGGPF